jgi:hypothetical protein
VSKGPRDFLGRELAIGCTVVYPTREGSDMQLRSGVLMDFACGPQGTDAWTVVVSSNTPSGKRRKGTGIPAKRTVRVS